MGDVRLQRGLSVIFVRFDRDKHAGALPALREHCATLGQVRMATVVVDNAMAGGEEPRADEGLPVVAGDNSAWEFSAFDAGVTWLREHEKLYDVTLLVTDAFRAYGDSFLGWSDRGLLEFCRRRSAVVGWVDSFQEPLRLLGSGYQAWMRTSYLVLPTVELGRLQPFAWPLPEIFSDDWRSPWLAEAPLSESLRRCLAGWLVRDAAFAPDRERWHSGFDLDEASFPLFRHKVRAILREHHLSIRMAEAGLPRYDLRVLGDTLVRGRLPHGDGSDEFIDGLEKWRAGRGVARAEPAPEAVRLLFAGDVGRPAEVARARAFAARVVPLVRQRFPGAVFEVIDEQAGGVEAVAAVAGTRILSPDESLRDPLPVAAVVAGDARQIRRAQARWLSAGRSLAGAASVVFDGWSAGVRGADSDVGVATTCSQALEEAIVEAAVARLETREDGEGLLEAFAEPAAGLETTAFRWYAEYEAWQADRQPELARREEWEQSLVKGPVPFAVRGLCYPCGRETTMHVDFEYGGDRSRLLPNWRERLVCQECGLNAKLRAMLHVLAEVVVPGRDPRLLVWELASELAEAARSRYGAVTAVSGTGQKLESFESERFDCLLVVDVLERVESPEEAIAACLGSLKPGGGMVLTAAFSRRRLRGRERAEAGSDAPRRDFGWSLLDAFRDAGFEDVAAHFFWSRPFAYLGGEQVVFAARKGAASG